MTGLGCAIAMVIRLAFGIAMAIRLSYAFAMFNAG
jgi:hypothetical protein